MDIHHILVAINQIAKLDAGAELVFGQSVAVIEEGDAVVARLTDGSELLMVVKRVAGDDVFVETQDHAKRAVTLSVQSGLRSLKIVAV